MSAKTEIQSVSLEDMVDSFGSPLYVYDAEVISRQFNNLAQAFSSVDLRIKYAMKASTNLGILKLLRSLGSGVDAVSINEVEIAFKAGYSAQDILFTPSCSPITELQRAYDLGVNINIDSLEILRWFGEEYGADAECCIRINPNIRAGGNKNIQTGHEDSKFGISIGRIQEVQQISKETGLKVVGLHVHTGSDIYDPEVFRKGVQLLFGVADGFSDLKYIDLGGGFKVAYKAGDPCADVAVLGNILASEYSSFEKAYGRKLQIWVEPGKYLVSESGLLLTTTTLVKKGPRSTFVGVDSGLNHLIRPMMYGAYHHISNASNPNGVEQVYNVVGYICEEDTFAEGRSLNEVREGDILAIHNAGAYGFSMSSNYNSRCRPAEVLVEDGKPKLVRRRETLDDLLLTQK